ncbi:sushi, von Willebrand factor type A, EGF and pentraxin domain-containing protein 1-like [Sycon ciliatum]|uniref:sushi, von Willebrand factor type A, EGF and pentraxin domain-containing protein 1-like n=1 Tax=Sycon ciliatum TaxID=27933 RepID=UPI0031F67F25
MALRLLAIKVFVGLTILITELQALKYALYFNCNTSAGEYLISSQDWPRVTSMAAASNRCTTTGNSHPIVSTAGKELCVSMYLSHINSRLQTNVGAYSSTGCTPNSSLCSPSAIVICQSSRHDARIGGNQCLKNLTLSNGLVTYPSGVIFPSQALYDCNVGYRNTGASYAVCNTLGNWDKAKGNCQALNCQAPGIPNGQMMGVPPMFQPVCFDGFTRVGPDIVYCSSDTNTTQLPNCTALNCQAPGILNGQMMGAPPMFQPVCFDGFARVGPDMVYCSSDTNTTQLPNCTAYSGKCAASTLDNGYIKEGSDGLAVRELFCNAGYRLHTSANYTCVSTTISKRIVSCKKLVCNSSTLVIENGHLQPAEGVINEQARVLCNTGFSLAGSGIATCGVSGTWKSNSTCKGDSCAAPNIPNSNISGIQATTGQLHYVGCEDGYKLEGSATIACSAPDLWTPFPHCTRDSCTAPNIPNSNISGLQATTGEVHYVGCEGGYNLEGNATIACSAPDLWTTLPRCEPVVCDFLPTFNNGLVIVGHTEAKFGTFAMMVCDPKYELQGNRTVMCDKNGSWASTGQTCKEIMISRADSNTTETAALSGTVGFLAGVILSILMSVILKRLRRPQQDILTDHNTGKRNKQPRATALSATEMYGTVQVLNTNDAYGIAEVPNENVAYEAVNGNQMPQDVIYEQLGDSEL